MDFHSDWGDIMKAWLSARGYSIPSGKDPQAISIIYFNARRRWLPQVPRQILKSREFSCSPQFENGLTQLEAKVERGDDINPYLSRKLKSANYDDALLNDWRVYHFHLGNVAGKDGFINRTGPVLFALVTESHFHEINVYLHGNCTNLDVIEIVHANWPEKIERFKLSGVAGISHVCTSADIKLLRSAHVNTILQTKDGTIYTPIGGGYMMNGTSSEVVMESVQHAKFITHLEQWVKDNSQVLTEELKKSGYCDGKPLIVKLEIDDSAIYAACPEYHTRFILVNRTSPH